MANQLFEDGQPVNINGNDMVCTAVGYQETDGERHSHQYTFRLKSDLDAEREAAEKAEEERKAAESNANTEGEAQ